MTIKMEYTPRGFVAGRFRDRYGWLCSIQKSSLASEDAIWLGCDETPNGERLGPIDKVSGKHIGARMHLTREHVEALLPLLQHFVETGELPHPEE